MELGTVAARTIVIYFVILIVLRMMGKREIGQLSIVDFVVSIMIAELAVLSIANASVPMAEQILPMVVLMLIQITLAFVSLKSDRLRTFIDGKSSGREKIDEQEMRKKRYNYDDLIIQLRQKNVETPADVEFAILESSGDLSVIKRMKEEAESNDHQACLPLPLVLDGKVQNQHLEKMNRTPLWLRQQLRKLGYRDIKKISYCMMTGENQFYIDEKQER
ncbi:hypothetical protein CR205_09620 [Alteribacter lacisalsi]|uniref:YetF C-terminal domain-containing protein n=1 Tax=Alteribacter lacisalsi TaxID=2045244 RepID=A0A2W0HYD3_9BACI|nr:DUF421 domain-containing protein [Alteribacter lacisalsi]PYZ98808.1 hypothetical protein CR205_09620 [Alteribacter lacisalsi]